MAAYLAYATSNNEIPTPLLVFMFIGLVGLFVVGGISIAYNYFSGKKKGKE